MALNATLLATELKALVDAIIANEGPKTNEEVTAALATAIVDHIVANAQVIIPSGSSAGTYNVQ